MALTTCNECGQQVSDKAEACPHCGAPVAAPVDYDQLPPTLESEAPVRNPNRLGIIIGVVVFLLGAIGIGGFFVWNYMEQQRIEEARIAREQAVKDSIAALQHAEEARKAAIIAAPDIPLNANQCYTTDMCPHSHKGLDVILDVRDQSLISVKIIKDGVEFQTFRFEEGDIGPAKTSDKIFLDANFDGYVDIFVGPVCDRTTSCLLLWNPIEKKFVQAEDEDSHTFNGNFEFCPSEKVVYRLNTGGWGNAHYTVLSWSGNRLVASEELLCTYLKSDYAEYGVSHRYTVRNVKTGRVIASTDKVINLPERWCERVSEPDREQELRYKEADAELAAAEEREFYNSSSGSTHTTQQSGSTYKSAYTFHNSGDVIDYLKHRTFVCQGLRLRIDFDGFTVNGNRGGGAPIVKLVRSNYAVIELIAIPTSTRLTFYVYPDADKIVDNDGNDWNAR